MDHAHRGETALKDGKFEEAITLFTKAIENSPTSPTYYIKRSTAYQRAKRYDEALSDADQAVIQATKRGKRELIAQAQLRRGIICFLLERYGDADFLLATAKKLDEKEKTVGVWQAKTQTKLKALEEDDPKRQVTVKGLPDPPEARQSRPDPENDGSSPATAQTSTGIAPAAKETQAVQTPASQIRHDWYQNNDNVYFTLLAKGVPKDQASVDIQPKSLSLSFPLSTGTTYDFSLEPLFAPIDPSASTFKVMSTKIEIVLRKKTQGQKWSSLEGATSDNPDATESTLSGTSHHAVPLTSDLTGGNKAGPVYPTSARGGPKNWDKIAASYTKPGRSSSNDDKKEKKDDEIYVDDDYDDEGDEANAFFKKLFKDADPDTKRAMMKSYQESGGTALSTNWEDVKKKRVEISPPEGMEAKKWEY